MSSYQTIANIALQHTYFSSGRFDAADIRPDHGTAQWLKQQGIATKQSENTLVLAIPSILDLSSLTAADPSFRLRFDCSPLDAAFVNYTEMPIEQSGKFVFTAEGQGETSISLSKRFETSPGPSSSIAIVELSLDDLKQGSTDNPITFTAQFEARALSWIYYITAPKKAPNAQLKLEGERAHLFTGPTAGTLPDGTATAFFSSGSNKIALKNRGTSGLSLIGVDDAGKEIAEATALPIPNPATGVTKVEIDGETKLVAAVYVYV